MRKISERKAGVVLNYLYLGINALASLLYVPVLLATIGASQYGLYQTIGSIVSYLAILGNGLASTLTRYYSIALVSKDRIDRCRAILSVAIKAYAVVTLIVLVIGFVITFNFDAWFSLSFTESEVSVGKQMMWIVTANAAFAIIGSIFTAIINAEERFIFAQSLNVVRAIAQPIAVIAVVLIQSSALGIVVAQFLVNIFVIIVNAAYCIRSFHPKINLRYNNQNLMMEMLKFTLFVLLGLIFDQILWRTDQIILGVIYGTEIVALYSIGTTLVAAYIMFSNSISSILLPKVSKMIESGTPMQAVSELFARVGVIQSIIVCLIETGFLLFGREFIALWAGSAFEPAYSIVIIFMIGMHLALIQNLGQAILQAKNRQAFKSVVYVCIAIANLIITIPASIAYGYIGCALTSMICLLIGTGPVINIYYKKVIGLDIKLFFKETARMLPAAILPAVLFFLMLATGIIPEVHNLVCLFLEIALYVVLYAISILMLGVRRDMRRKLLMRFWAKLTH